MTNPWAPTECETCGASRASSETKRCDPCWEVEHRLEWYLTTENGLNNVLEEIKSGGLSSQAFGSLMAYSIAEEMKKENSDD